MAQISIACYRPKEGREDELLTLVREHAPTLRSLGFVTDREHVLMEAGDGTVVEIFEWASREAKVQAHAHPAVRSMWERFGELSEGVTLSTLAEAGEEHPNFRPL